MVELYTEVNKVFIFFKSQML